MHQTIARGYTVTIEDSYLLTPPHHVWLMSSMCDYNVLYSLIDREQRSKTLNFFSQCTTHICGQPQCKVTSLGIECDMRDILTILRRSIVVVLQQYVPQHNGGVALHLCRAKTVEEFVSETAQPAQHKELLAKLLRANTPSVGYISRFLGTSPVARDIDEQWRAVRTAFDRLCFMYVDAMSALNTHTHTHTHTAHRHTVTHNTHTYFPPSHKHTHTLHPPHTHVNANMHEQTLTTHVYKCVYK